MELVIILVVVGVGLWWFLFRQKPETSDNTEPVAPYKVEAMDAAPAVLPAVEVQKEEVPVVEEKPAPKTKKSAPKAKPKAAKATAKKPKAKSVSKS